jgi:ankyrin repeat protein
MAASGAALDSSVNHWNQTRLHLAVDKLDYVEVKRLLAAGANPNVPDINGNTPLYNIAGGVGATGHRLTTIGIANSISITKALLDAKADANKKNRDNDTPLMSAQRTYRKPVEILALLVGATSNENIKAALFNVTNLTTFEKTLLVCDQKQLQFVASDLLFKLTKLHDSKENLSLLKVLMKYLFKLENSILKNILETRNSKQNSLLHQILSDGDGLDSVFLREILSAFKMAGASVNILNRDGQTPLFYLLDFSIMIRFMHNSKEFYATVESLLNCGAENTNPNSELSPLVLVEKSRFPANIVALVKRGALTIANHPFILAIDELGKADNKKTSQSVNATALPSFTAAGSATLFAAPTAVAAKDHKSMQGSTQQPDTQADCKLQ